jgi:hypothetical protein
MRKESLKDSFLVNRFNKALTFYQKLGFEIVGKRRYRIGSRLFNGRLHVRKTIVILASSV